MTDIHVLISRIDQEIAAEAERQKGDWAKLIVANRERGLRLQRYETEAKHIIELLKPRLDAFIERFKAVVKVEPVVRQYTRAVNLTFAATVAKVTLLFEVFPDEDVNHIRLECTQEIIPVVVRYDKQSVLEFPLGEVQDDAVVQWFDDRIIAFVKAYVALVRQDAALAGATQGRVCRGPRRQDSVPEVPCFVHAGARRADLLLRGRGHPPGVRETAGGSRRARGKGFIRCCLENLTFDPHTLPSPPPWGRG